MAGVERQLRRFRAAFFVEPSFANWARTRGRELERAGEIFEVVLVWGRRRFRIGNVPRDEPYFAIERSDGSIEQSSHVNASPRWRW